jgi:hypothetical protein
VVIQQLVLGATEEYDGSAWTAGGNMSTARRFPGWCRYTNSRFMFWWLIQELNLQTPQKNMMDGLDSWWKFKHSKRYFRRLWVTNGRTLGFGGRTTYTSCKY